MQVETNEPDIIERIAALDVGKAEVVCCARLPSEMAGSTRSCPGRAGSAAAATA